MKRLLSVLLPVLAMVTASAQTNPSAMNRRLEDAILIALEKQRSARPIPQQILNNAKGIAIISITRGGLGVGGQHGEGILIAKNRNGKWSAPSAFNASGGSVGFQIGVEIKKLIYVLNNADAVDAFTRPDKFKLGALATATAGPDSVAEEAHTMAEQSVWVYSLTEGAFAGAVVGGEVMGTDLETNRRTYGPNVTTADILSGSVQGPEKTQQLYDALGLKTGLLDGLLGK